MPQEISNKLRGPSTIRVSSAGTYTIALSDLSSNATIETVQSAIITNIKWSLSAAGQITITRGGTETAKLFGSGHWKHDELNLTTNPGGNIVIVLAGDGSAILGVTKNANYSIDVQKL